MISWTATSISNLLISFLNFLLFSWAKESMSFTPKLMIFIEDSCIERHSSTSPTKQSTSTLAYSMEMIELDENATLRI